LFPAILERPACALESDTVARVTSRSSPAAGDLHGEVQLVKDYVFWGLFALVVIGIGVSQWDRRRRSLKAKELEEAYRAGLAAAAQPRSGAGPAAKPPAAPAAGAPEAAFDANATRVHFRGSAEIAPAAPLHRDAAPLPPRKAARLVCVGGSQKDHSFPITAAGITIGREPKNDVVLDRRSAGVIPPCLDRHRRPEGGAARPRLHQRHLPQCADRRAVGEVVLSPGDTIFFGGHGRDQFRFVLD
jgi:hypothetical protein